MVAYAKGLKKQGFEVLITQLETSFQVRVREKGVPAKTLTFPSLREAEQHVSRLESDNKVGLFRDYMEGAKTTTAELIQRYIKEECPSLKGSGVYISMLKAMLDDIRKLVELRYGTEGAPPGRRNLYLFLAACFLAHAVVVPNLKEEIRELATHIAPTWTEAELQSCIASVVSRAEASASGQRISYARPAVDGHQDLRHASLKRHARLHPARGDL